MNLKHKFQVIDFQKVRNVIAILSYNEVEALPSLISNLSLKLGSQDLVMILDDSEPKVSVLLEKSVSKSFKNSLGQLVFVNSGIKNGRGAAVRKGMELSDLYLPNFVYFIECDSDESHQVEDIFRVIRSDKNCDLLIGSRYLEDSRIINWPFLRRIFSKVLNVFIPFLLGLKLTDITNGLRRYSNRSVKILLKYDQINFGFTYLSEQAFILHKNGYSISEIPITFVNRRLGSSTVGASEIYSSLKGIIDLFSNKKSFEFEK
jgi:dolichol-phosphate mannosyltransferase